MIPTRRDFLVAGLPATRDPSDENLRRRHAYRLRQQAARLQSERPLPTHSNNGDEAAYPNWMASFSKGLPHNQRGDVDPTACQELLRAVITGDMKTLEDFPYTSSRRLVNPMAGWAWSLEGCDSHAVTCAPAPPFASVEAALEMVELYWQALARDIPFSHYEQSPVIAKAAAELRQTPASVFRGIVNHDQTFPFISQFLWKPIPWLSGNLPQRNRTPLPGSDYLTSVPGWLLVQNGAQPQRPASFDDVPRYIRNGRDLAEYVHYDALYQAFLSAALILMNDAPETLLNQRQLYSDSNPYMRSKVQEGFVTFGRAMVTDWLARVTTAALKACWHQKWHVHRRLRPEEFGGRVEQAISGAPGYPVPAALLDSAAVAHTRHTFGSALLPQAYPEGSPLHPAYPSGHATVSGACLTVLKALFDETARMPDCVVASEDGLELIPLADSDLTIGGELNKLGSNIAVGRGFAGIHYRSDAAAGVRLGEQVAISVLQDLKRTLPEPVTAFRFTSLDGVAITI